MNTEKIHRTAGEMRLCNRKEEMNNTTPFYAFHIL